MGKVLDYFNQQKGETTKVESKTPDTKRIIAFLDEHVNQWFTAKEIKDTLNVHNATPAYLAKTKQIQKKSTKPGSGRFLFSSLKTTTSVRTKSVKSTKVSVVSTPVIKQVVKPEIVETPKKKKSFINRLLNALLTVFED